jgi:hypothetical protein
MSPSGTLLQEKPGMMSMSAQIVLLFVWKRWA